MASSTPDAIALLKADHRAVEALFEKFESARNASTKEHIARQICTELSVHTMIEEEIFYPALRGKIDRDLLDEAYVEHDGAKLLIAQLMTGSPGDDFFDAKMKVLCDEIMHHVAEEERRGDGMFAQARAAGTDLQRLGGQLRARKEQLLAEIKANGLPAPETRTMEPAQVTMGQVKMSARLS